MPEPAARQRLREERKKAAAEREMRKVLRAYSLTAGSVAVAVSGAATMWLPWPWWAAAWAILAIAACVCAGLLAAKLCPDLVGGDD